MHGFYWIAVAQDWSHWRAVVIVMVNLQGFCERLATYFHS
jgi:hypothetical protein